MKRFLSPRHYLAVLRRQPAHVQHVFSAIVAGAVTALLASGILYFDYGFWHERYSRGEMTVEQATTTTPSTPVQSPVEMISSFFDEATHRFKNIGDSSSSLLEGKEVFER